MSDDGAWLPDDEVPVTLMPILQIFFEQMWRFDIVHQRAGRFHCERRA